MTKSFLRVLPHVEQIKGKFDPRAKCRDIFTCGAASLCMIYLHFGIPADHDRIWSEISWHRPGGGEYTTSVRILRHALDHQVPCTCASLKALDKSLALCLEKGVELILLHHKDRKHFYGHYAVLSNIQGGSIYVNDPFHSPEEGGINRRVREIEELMRPSREPGEEIVRKNTVLAFMPPSEYTDLPFCTCPNCGHSFPAIPEVISLSEAILCPGCDNWIESGQALSVDR